MTRNRRIYDDYTDEEIEAMEREFDDWQRWTYEQRERTQMYRNLMSYAGQSSIDSDDWADRLVSSSTPQELANAQRNAKPAPC